MINDQVVTQLRYLERLLAESPRNDDGFIVIGAGTETDMKDSIGRAKEALTGKPRN
jgi:hypothetical protein